MIFFALSAFEGAYPREKRATLEFRDIVLVLAVPFNAYPG